MSEAALDRLMTGQKALVAALDANDIDAIETLTAAVGTTLAEVRASGGWRTRADLRPRLVEALKTADAIKARLNYLADRNRRQFDRLAAAATGAPRTTAYGRAGRLG